jgi:hypothetical protein
MAHPVDSPKAIAIMDISIHLVIQTNIGISIGLNFWVVGAKIWPHMFGKLFARKEICSIIHNGIDYCWLKVQISIFNLAETSG